MKQLEI